MESPSGCAPCAERRDGGGLNNPPSVRLFATCSKGPAVGRPPVLQKQSRGLVHADTPGTSRCRLAASGIAFVVPPAGDARAPSGDGKEVVREEGRDGHS